MDDWPQALPEAFAGVRHWTPGGCRDSHIEDSNQTELNMIF